MPTPIKIAIADDYPSVRDGLKISLQEFGFEVIIEAVNGEDLISKITHGNTFPDVCIVDYSMPVMNGVQTTIALRAEWRSIKIIGFSMDENIGPIMLSKGADRFLLKSCELSEIRNTILELYNHQS